MKDIYVVGCCRTAIGSFGGTLKNVSAVDLGTITAQEALRRAGVSPQLMDETIFGCVLTAGLGQNVARQIAINAGVPIEKTAFTVGMVCGSGMKAVIEAARAIECGDCDLVLAGGTENMSASPYALSSMRWGSKMNDQTLVDIMQKDALWDAFNNYHMGITAENICDHYGITRNELDEFAVCSQKRAAFAQKEGRFADEIVPVRVKQKKQTILFCEDEFVKPDTSAEVLAGLRPAFREGGRVTAGNASGINDGAAAIVLASESAVRKNHLKPLARLSGWGHGGVDPAYMGMGPVPAVRDVLRKTGRKAEDIDLFELNEAFAAQSIAVMRELNLDRNKVNVNGGALALGHPVGASGARIIVTLLHEMNRSAEVQSGLATLCIGGGMGVSTLFDKC